MTPQHSREVVVASSDNHLLLGLVGGTARPQTVSVQSASNAAAAAPSAPARKQDANTRQTAQPQKAQPQQESVTVGDYLVKSLKAHSLDLPPQAARVRMLTITYLFAFPEQSAPDYTRPHGHEESCKHALLAVMTDASSNVKL